MIQITIVQPRQRGPCPFCRTPDVSERVQCALCLDMVDADTVRAAIKGDNDERVFLDGPLCPACFHGGAAVIEAHLRRTADNHRRFAAQYDEWASGPIDLPGMGTA